MFWTAIVAMDEKGVIGVDQKLPWHIKDELAHFKRVTLNKDILMGRKTYNSLPKSFDKRHVYILTRNPNYIPEKKKCKTTVITDWKPLLQKELIICGGLEVYEQLIEYCDRLIVSIVKGDYDGNKVLEIDYSDYNLVSVKEYKEFTVYIWERDVTIA